MPLPLWLDLLYEGEDLVSRHVLPMWLHMAAHVVHARAPLPTKSAGKHSVGRMHCAEMLGQVSPLEEGAAAHLAGEALLRNVTPLVRTALRLGVEPFVADVADKCQAASLGAAMRWLIVWLELRGRDEPHLAPVTEVGDPVGGQVVGVQVLPGVEGAVAHGAGTLADHGGGAVLEQAVLRVRRLWAESHAAVKAEEAGWGQPLVVGVLHTVRLGLAVSLVQESLPPLRLSPGGRGAVHGRQVGSHVLFGGAEELADGAGQHAAVRDDLLHQGGHPVGHSAAAQKHRRVWRAAGPWLAGGHGDQRGDGGHRAVRVGRGREDGLAEEGVGGGNGHRQGAGAVDGAEVEHQGIQGQGVGLAHGAGRL